ncbi:MAG: DsbA family protein [Bdellovibrionales bacterium]|jgi:protein-disulfide isomerase|nr:DsbA family protein [Bdellovibrionales bacterium]
MAFRSVALSVTALFGVLALAGCGGLIDKQIEAWVEKNPETIIKSLQSFQRRQQEENQPKPEMVKEFSKELFENATSPSVGNGKIKIAYFFDFNCGHCARQSEIIEDVLSKTNDVTVIYKNFPILHPTSELAARGALAANMQGKYKEFYKEVYKTQNKDADALKKIASKLKLDVKKWETDMDGEAVTGELDHVRQLAQKMKLSGTPMIAIAPDKIFPGRVDQLWEIVQSLK